MSYTRPTPGGPGNNHVPAASYRVLATKVDNTPSQSSGAPMSTINVQILSPATAVGKDGKTYDTAGKEGQLRVVFTEKNMANCFTFLTLIGCPLPAQAATQEEDIAAIQAALAAYLNGSMTFEMVVSSKRDVVKGPNSETLRDSLGREILGNERPDFNSFNVVGIPKRIDELVVAANPTRPY